MRFVSWGVLNSEMDSLSSISEELGEIEGQINDIFRALS